MVCLYAQHFSRFRAARNRPDFDSGAASDSNRRNVRYFGDARFASFGVFANDNSQRVRNLVIQFTEKGDGLIFNVRVVPRASKSEIVGELDGALKIKLKSPPVDGAANAELIKVLSKKFGVAKSAVEILSGQTSKQKQVRVRGIKHADLLNLIGV